MKPIRVCIYGGTDLQGSSPQFTEELAYTILKSMSPAVIITGGFLYKKPTEESNEASQAISTDVAALNGAKRYTQEYGVALKDCFEAWLPDPDLDDRLESEGVVRMSEGDKITVRIMRGKTPLGRRLAMVSNVNFVVTVSGRRHTEVIVEQALELGVPVLPIPDFGGDSKELLEKYEQRIATAFESDALANCLKTLSEEMTKDRQKAVGAVVNLIRTAKLGKCLILTPFDDLHRSFYKLTVEPSVAKHMLPVRLDEIASSDQISLSFAEAVHSSWAIIADITTINKNVMYEIGYAHALGRIPLMYTRDEKTRKKLPVYFRTLNVPVATGDELIELIEKHLLAIKANRRISW
ncbi:hypothetical protein [Spirosoma validum]|uniref:Nucleoside 2-deoxyribosyltransferase n=1 Tax=Spirosoma validum TaxID=2771355 RepID=A0A927B1W5_9BACT|nr:hypothetical protein [Spirosoma validum]MBD2754056.1 hypothetical protein [Spirosoma validum]